MLRVAAVLLLTVSADIWWDGTCHRIHDTYTGVSDHSRYTFEMLENDATAGNPDGTYERMRITINFDTGDKNQDLSLNDHTYIAMGFWFPDNWSDAWPPGGSPDWDMSQRLHTEILTPHPMYSGANHVPGCSFGCRVMVNCCRKTDGIPTWDEGTPLGQDIFDNKATVRNNW